MPTLKLCYVMPRCHVVHVVVQNQFSSVKSLTEPFPKTQLLLMHLTKDFSRPLGLTMGMDLGTGMSKNLGVEAATTIGGIDTDMGTGMDSGIGMCIDQGIGVGTQAGAQTGQKAEC